MKIDINELHRLESKSLITLRKHPTAALLIANYTPKVQFDRLWDESPLLKQCRGLIVDEFGEVISRPFPKFFNLGEHQGPLPDGDFEVTEKLDGSLGILYWIPQTTDSRAAPYMPFIATRGSFDSEQARLANHILWETLGAGCMDGLNGNLPFHRGRTYLFEIIGPSNRIVVRYPEDTLRLITIIDNETGRDLPWEPQVPFDYVQRYDAASVAELASRKKDNFEGYVVRWLETDYRLKVKLDDYLRLHKVMTGATARRIWEVLAEGQSLELYLHDVPDEFATWVRATANGLLHQFDDIETDVIKEFNRIIGDDWGVAWPARKQFASLAVPSIYRDILFALYDGHDYRDKIWKRIKPKAEEPFTGETE